jgi:hypothetical protein
MTNEKHLNYKVANLGNRTFQFNLAKSYENGHGIAKNVGKARRWEDLYNILIVNFNSI